MISEKEIIYSIHQLNEYPPDVSHPVYREYPNFKLGVMSGVEYFSKKLVPVVEEIMAANPGYKYWVLTSPPSRELPTAANLLSYTIYKYFERKNKTENCISFVKLYNRSYEGPIDESALDFIRFSGYSRYSCEERLEIIHNNRFVINEEDFHDRGIIFINDINVTGASQEYISGIFKKVYPGKINWLYIIDCDKKVGKENPRLENEINNLNINSLSDFGAILSREDIKHTAKCISKVFTYSTAELEQLFEILNAAQKLRLLESIKKEELYKAGIFKEKMELIRRVCH